jgi:hypothetical protein
VEIDPDTRKRLIEFAGAQMAKKGEIDTLIFTTRDITKALQKDSDNLTKATTDAGEVLRSMDNGPGE